MLTVTILGIDPKQVEVQMFCPDTPRPVIGLRAGGPWNGQVSLHLETLEQAEALVAAGKDAVRMWEGLLCATCRNAPPSGEGDRPALCAACAERELPLSCAICDEPTTSAKAPYCARCVAEADGALPACRICEEPTGSTEADLCPKCDAVRDRRQEDAREHRREGRGKFEAFLSDVVSSTVDGGSGGAL